MIFSTVYNLRHFQFRFQSSRAIHLLLSGLCLVLFSCSALKKSAEVKNNKEVSFAIIQINDFYEISPLEGGKIGGAARIASLRKKVMKEYPNTFTVLAGDFLSPSLIGTLKWENERIRGKQMVEALNTLGLDLATFGNHEFDIDLSSLQKRLNESKFEWVSSNVLQVRDGKKSAFGTMKNGVMLDIPKYKIIRFVNEHGASVRVGFVAPCLPANQTDFVYYEDIYESTANQIRFIKDSIDFLISLSHLNKEDDLEMAKRFKELNLILGGHEHDHMKYEIGRTVMTKADANAKTAYVHKIKYNTTSKTYTLISELVKLDEHIPLDPEVNQVVEKWKSIETKIIRDMGFDPDEVLMKLSTPYDAREQTTRNSQCAFGELIAKSMFHAYKDSDLALLNSGGIRVDDMLSGSLSQYDILRSLPYGGSILLVMMKGSLLQKIAIIGEKNKGSGGYLQRYRLSQNNKGSWFVGNEILNEESYYKVSINDYLLTGKEKGLDFLTRYHPELKVIHEANPSDKNDDTNDIRTVIIQYIKQGGK